MNDVLGTLGVATILGWVSLPLLAAVAAHRADEPASRQRALTFALLLALFLLAVPWLRVWTHHVTALCFSKQTITAALSFAPSQFLLERAAGPSFWPIAGAIGAASIVIGVVRTIVAARRLTAIVNRARLAPRALAAAAARLAGERNLVTPEVRISTLVAVPFVTGLRRRVIVLPEELLQELDTPALELVLIHELVHVERKDVELAWLVALARVPFQLHPLARWLGSEIAVAREQAVDALVASEDPNTYARVLVDVAAHAGARPCPGEVAMSASALERRILRLIGAKSARRGGLAPVLLAALLLAGLAMMAPLRAEGSDDRRTELIRCDDENTPMVEELDVLEEDCTRELTQCIRD